MGKLRRTVDSRIQSAAAGLPGRTDYWNRGWSLAHDPRRKVGRLRPLAISHGYRHADHRCSVVDIHPGRRRAIDLGQGTSRQREDLSHPAGFGIDLWRGNHRRRARHSRCVRSKFLTMDWRNNLITTPDQIRELLKTTTTNAVLGIKTGAQAGQPAFYVPSYMQSVGFKIIPVPVYYPEVTEILGERVYRTVSAVPEEIDMVNVFRRPQDIPPHVADI